MSYVGNTVLPSCEAACAKVVELCRHDAEFDNDALGMAALGAMQELLELVAVTGIIESELNYDQLRMLLKLPPKPDVILGPRNPARITP